MEMVRKQLRGGMSKMERNSTMGSVGTFTEDGWVNGRRDGYSLKCLQD